MLARLQPLTQLWLMEMVSSWERCGTGDPMSPWQAPPSPRPEVLPALPSPEGCPHVPEVPAGRGGWWNLAHTQALLDKEGSAGVGPAPSLWKGI